MVHSDFFTPWTVYEHVTTRERLRTYFVGNFLSRAPTNANFLLKKKKQFSGVLNYVLPLKADLVSDMPHHAPYKCFGDLRPDCQCYIVYTSRHNPCHSLVPVSDSTGNLHPRLPHHLCRRQGGDRGDSGFTLDYKLVIRHSCT